MRRSTEQIEAMVSAAEELGWSYVEYETRKKHDRVWFSKDGKFRFCVAARSPSIMKRHGLETVRKSVRRVLTSLREA